MYIYELVFGMSGGQVHCVFHEDSNRSAGVSDIGQYNCFTCGAKAHDSKGFIAKYFEVSIQRATAIHKSLQRGQDRNPKKEKVEPGQRSYLKSVGISDKIIDKYFFSSVTGKLYYDHKWNGLSVGYTWFNSPELPNYFKGHPKYKYDTINIAGMVTPYDDILKYNNVLICEGEKDMLTAKSMGIPNAIAKVGGAKTYLIGGINFHNKEVVIAYDCDKAGREGAAQDATYLTTKCECKVKVLDLGLNNKEDLNDYFIKYGKTVADFTDLVRNTPIYVPEPVTTVSKIENLYKNLTQDEKLELRNILDSQDDNDNNDNNTQGEIDNGKN